MSDKSVVSYHCENEFWVIQMKVNVFSWSSEPLCALSGLVMCYLALKCNAGLAHPPLQFCLARASLFVCGIGTAVYHMLDQSIMEETRVNGIMLDGVTMALVTVNIFLLHLSEWMRRHLFFFSVASMVYLLFWVFTNDMRMFTYLTVLWDVNGVSMLTMAIQYPLFIAVYFYVVVRVLCIHGLFKIYPMWIVLFIALCSWAANQFGCSHSRFLFVGHVVWHVCIGYVAVYLMVLGLLNGGEFQLKTESSEFWPTVEVVKKEENVVQVIANGSGKDKPDANGSTKVECRLDTSNLFNPAYRAGYQQLCLQ
jgi:hypothetical protein